MFAHTSQRLEAKLLYIGLDAVVANGGLVVILYEMNDVEHSEHPCKCGFLAVPEGC